MVRVSSAPDSTQVAIAPGKKGLHAYTYPSAIVGPTCEGSVVGEPGGRGAVLLSAPYSRDPSLGGREDLRLWRLDTAVTPKPTLTMLGRLWGCKAAYSAFSQESSPGGAEDVFSLFEAGEAFRYASIVLARFRAPSHAAPDWASAGEDA